MGLWEGGVFSHALGRFNLSLRNGKGVKKGRERSKLFDNIIKYH